MRSKIQNRSTKRSRHGLTSRSPKSKIRALDPFIVKRRHIESALDRYLVKGDPLAIHQAMRYSVLGGGKRLRALLVLSAGEACGGRPQALLPAACSIEMIHAYSLVHDDLPCMDDDDVRRGKPTTHRKFGEAMAVLAGDALLTRAFEVMLQARVPSSDGRARVHQALQVLSEAAGTAGLIGGQVVDIQSEGRRVTRKAVEGIHRRKTGALITASVRIGGLLAGASSGQMRALAAYGANAGLAFQIIDDCLNESGDARTLGKKAGSDRARGKATYPKVMGIQASYREAERLMVRAEQSLRPFGGRGKMLLMLANRMVRRER